MKKLSLLATLPIIIVSCKKSSPNPVTPKALLVSSTISLDLPDTVTTSKSFTYDDSNRLVKEIDSEKFENNITDGSTINYQYDANNNVVKITFIDGNESGEYNIFYINGQPSYANALLTEGTTIFYNGLYCKYTVQNQNVISVDAPTSGNFPSMKCAYSNNNLSTYIEEFYSPTLTITTNYTFGEQNSPFKNSRFKWYLGLVGFDSLEEYDENSEESYTSSSNNQNVTIAQIQNTYNSSGYPTKIVYIYGVNIPNATETYTYINGK